MKKLLALLILACMLVTMLASCNKNNGTNDGNTDSGNTDNSGETPDSGETEEPEVDNRDYMFNATFDNVSDMNDELKGTDFSLEVDSGRWPLQAGEDGYLYNENNDGRIYVKDDKLTLDDGEYVLEFSLQLGALPSKTLSLITWVRQSVTASKASYDWFVKIDSEGNLYVDDETTPTGTRLEVGKKYIIGAYHDGSKVHILVNGEEIGERKMTGKELVSSKLRIFEKDKGKFSATIDNLCIYHPEKNNSTDAQRSVFDALAENSKVTLSFAGYTNKDFLSYAVGEEMTFDIYLMAGEEVVSAPYFYYTIEGEDGQEKTDGFVDGSLGHFTVKGSMSKPGTLRVTVFACDENKNILTKNNSPLHIVNSNGAKENLCFVGGAVAGFSDIKSYGNAPVDLESYWNGIVADCYNGDINLLRFEELDVADYNEAKVSSHKLYLVEIECEGGFATGYLSVPVDGEKIRLKATFVSYGNTKKPKPAFTSDAAVFTICAHSYHLDDPDAAAPDGYGFDLTENQNRDNVYFKNMFIRNIMATRFLKAYIGDTSFGTILYNGETVSPLGRWEKGDNFTVDGGSQAGFQAVAITALDKDVTVCSVALTWFCDIGGEALGRFEGWNPEYTDALMYYDCCSLATLIGENVEVRVSAAGLGDTTSEPSGIIAFYNALNCTKALTMYQNRSHTYNPPISVVYSVSK